MSLMRSGSRLASCLALLAFALLSGAAHAAEPSAQPGQAGKVDVSALRYYASHNELDYYKAEVRRLRTLYPDWTPPADFSALASDDNPEAPLWALFAKDDMTGLDKAVAALAVERPGWKPSGDLAAKIAAKKARSELIAASDKGDHAAVLRLAAANPTLGGCADPEAAWRVAAAKAGSDERDAALADYRALVTTCPQSADRRATVEKALAVLGPAAARPLLALGKTDASGKNESADLADAFMRAAIGASTPAASLADAAGSPDALAPARTLTIRTRHRSPHMRNRPICQTNPSLIRTATGSPCPA